MRAVWGKYGVMGEFITRNEVGRWLRVFDCGESTCRKLASGKLCVDDALEDAGSCEYGEPVPS